MPYEKEDGGDNFSPSREGTFLVAKQSYLIDFNFFFKF